MLRTQLQFRSPAFPPLPDEAEQINPGRHGRRLADYLAEALPARGFAVRTITAEDWGWMVELQHEAFPLWIGCGNIDGEGDDDDFLCFIEPARPTVWRWFRRIDTRATVARLADALEAALRAHPGVRAIEWVE